MGACAKLGMACGDNIVPTLPVNTALPAVAVRRNPAAVLTATAGSWLNRPTAYALQWQRAAGGDWAAVPGAIGPSYVATQPPTRARPCAWSSRRPTRTARRSWPRRRRRRSPRSRRSSPARKPAAPTRLQHRAARPRAPRQGHAGGDASSPSRPGARCARGGQGRGHAGHLAPAPVRRPQAGALRCALTKRVRTRTRTVRLPAARVLVRSAEGRAAGDRRARRPAPARPRAGLGRQRLERAVAVEQLAHLARRRRRCAGRTRRARARGGRRRGGRAGR